MKKMILLSIGMIIFVSSLTAMAEEEEEQQEKERPKSVIIKYQPQQISRVIPLRTAEYGTIEEICKPMLSESGTMAYLKERNSVIIYDYETTVKKISSIIDKIDPPAVNIRIDVDFMGSTSGAKDSFNGKVNYKNFPGRNNQIIIKNGKIIKPDSIKINASQQRNSGSRNTSQFILTKSGHPARLWVGKTIVDPTWLRWRPLRPTTIISGPGGTIVVPGSDNDIVWRDIGSSLYVLPKYLGNGKIDLEVYPVVSYLVDEPENVNNMPGRGQRRRKTKRQSVRVEDISTHLTLQSGQRVYMGGVINSNKSFYKNLFGPEFLSRDDSNSILDMYITATVIDPSGQSYKSNIPETSDKSGPVLVDTPTREDPQEMFRRMRQ